VAKIGVIHYNFPGLSLDEFIEYAATTGFKYAEMAITDVWPEGDENPEGRAEIVRARLDAAGLAADTLQAANDFIVFEEDEVRRQVDRMRRIVGLAKILGADTIRTEGGWDTGGRDDEAVVAAIAECLKRCAEFAEVEGVRLAVDNHGQVTNNIDLQLDVLGRVGSKSVGANLDTMNYRWYGYSVRELPDVFRRVAPYVFHTHMKDGTGSLKEYQGAALGEGEVPLDAAFGALDEVGYDGVWCVEYEGKEGLAGFTKCFEYLKNKLADD